MEWLLNKKNLRPNSCDDSGDDTGEGSWSGGCD